MQYQLRPAVQQDASTIYRLFLRLHEESEIALPPVNPVKAMHGIVHAIGQDLAVVLGAEKGGRWVIVGALGLTAGADWFGDEGSLRDLSVYVTPEYRSFQAARLLVGAGKAMAAKHRVTLRLGIFGGKDMPRKLKLYERLGFRPMGVMLVGD